MANVDPFIIQWPQKWVRDPEIGPVVTYLNRFLHDLYLRTGGGNDAIAELDQSVNAEDSRRLSEHRQLTKKVRTLELELDRINTALNEMKRKQSKPTEEDNAIAGQLKRLENRVKTLELE